MAKKTSSTTGSTMLQLSQLITFFQNNYSRKSFNSIKSDINQIELIYQSTKPGHSIVEWFYDSFITNPNDPIGYVMGQLNPVLSSSTLPRRTLSSRRSRFKNFAQVVIGFFYANVWLNVGNHDLEFCKIIAENALFADKDVFTDVCSGTLGTNDNKIASIVSGYNNPYGSWDYMLHYRNTKQKRNTPGKNDPSFPLKYPGAKPCPLSDNNSYANLYIKKAVLESFERKGRKSLFTTRLFKDYEACHIWANPTEREYYCSIGNLVLIPRALAQLTDHNDAVKELLRKRAWDLFKFKPGYRSNPPKSKYYKRVTWRQI